MNLEAWVEEQMTAIKSGGGHTTKKEILEGLARKAGISYMTLSQTERGARMGNYEKARQVSQATDWKVTIPELCGDPALNTPALIAQFQALATVAGHA